MVHDSFHAKPPRLRPLTIRPRTSRHERPGPFRTPQFRPVRVPARARPRLEPSGYMCNTTRDHTRLNIADTFSTRPHHGRMAMWLRSLDALHIQTPRPLAWHAHTPLYAFNLYLPDCDPPAARPSRPIGPNNLTGAMAGVFFASVCIVAPSVSPINHAHPLHTFAVSSRRPPGSRSSGVGGSCVSGERVFQHDAGVPRSPT